MEFLKRVFTCKTKNEEKDRCDTNKEKRTSQSSQEGNVDGLKKRKAKDIENFREFFKETLNQIRITEEPLFRYIIPSDWMKKVLLYCDEKTENLIKSSIQNANFIDKKNNNLKKDLNQSKVCLVIYEIMIKIQEYFVVDYIIRVPLRDMNQLSSASIKIFERIEKKGTFDDNESSNLEETNKIIFFENDNKNGNNEEDRLKESENKREKIGDDISNTSQKIKVEKMKKITPDPDIEPEKKQIIEDDEEGGLSDKKTDDKSPQVSVKVLKDENPKKSNSLPYMHELSSFKKYFLNPKGLSNPSVYCFMNTCMQCLISIPEFNEYFREGEYEKDCKNSKKKFNACKVIKEFIDYYDTENGKFLKPPKSLYNICHSFLPPNTQHDCQEFLRRLLSKIQEELNTNKKYTIPDKSTFSQHWQIYRENNHCFIDSLFTGLMKSTVICHKCKFQSDTFDPFLDISLEIDKRTKNLVQCFKSYFALEDIDCEYKCEKCKKKTSITKKLQIVVSPNILTLHIKRFEEIGRKFNGPIEFGYNLDISNYTSKDSCQNNNYELFAVAVHKGYSSNSGHYIAFGKRKNGWFVFNDSSCYPLSNEDDDSTIYSDAYVLFFRRCDS